VAAPVHDLGLAAGLGGGLLMGLFNGTVVVITGSIYLVGEVMRSVGVEV